MTDALTFAEMLKEEYVHFHGNLPLLFLSDAGRLARLLHTAPADDTVAAYFKAGLPREARQELADGWGEDQEPSERLRAKLVSRYYSLLSDPQLHLNSTQLNAALIAAGLLTTGGARPDLGRLTEEQWLLVNSHLLGLLYPGVTGESPTTAGMVKVLHCAKHSALCLSGGGIRSATFNLGVLQGLARHGLLEHFDYLSTVSGGGFIGGWLTAWIHRHERGLAGVVDELSDEPPADRVLEPDPRPLSWLRTYSNYLSPKLGLLNADTWTLVAMVLRNMLLNWLVFIPWLVAALLLPRLWVAFVNHKAIDPTGNGSWWTGLLAGGVFLTFVSLNLPSGRKTNREPGSTGQGADQFWYLMLNLLPLVISAAALTTYWARIPHTERASLNGLHFFYFACALLIIPWIVTIVLHVKKRFGPVYARLRVKRNKYVSALLTFLIALVAILGATAATAGGLLITGYVTRWAASLFVPAGADGLGDDPRLYATLAVPALIGLLSLGGTLLAGFTSRLTGDEDQEWWARAGAWMLIVMIVWAAVCALVLYGPSLFLDLQVWTNGWRFWKWPWETMGKVFGILTGIVSGAVALFGGFSARTPANEKEAKQSGVGNKALSLATPILAVVFLAFLVMLFSLAAHTLLLALAPTIYSLFGVDPPMWWAWPSPAAKFLLASAASSLAGAAIAFNAPDPLAVIRESSVYLLVLLGALVVAVGVLMGGVISTNRFSLHYMWRNRIIRAYLGASHIERRPNRFTSFDSEDNIHLYKLVESEALVEGKKERKLKLFHVLNFALNLAGGGRLDWQDRKSESFTASPLHCGSFQPADTRVSRRPLGYRSSAEYTGGGGITLGTSVAISGAFVSPNMGYMMTSPVVRFLMTLFNVRFGWWLGNPRSRTGGSFRLLRWLGVLLDKLRPTYKNDSPTLSILPIVQEAFGMTNDTSAYVYLSDGGHFENLGLYEMVARRCHFIVVSDASTDNDYSFGSLGMAVRQIRVDLGVPIEFKEFAIVGAKEGKDGRGCAVGLIRYSCVDAAAPDGVLIYVKPTLTGEEPRDVINYARDNASFPQEIIVDQWFSEAQFESYRALGSYIVNDLTGGTSRRRMNFEQFEEAVKKYIERTAPPNDVTRTLDFLKELIRDADD